MSLECKGRKSTRSPRILLVGAGAVGQYYGLCLQRGGAEVSFLVRPKYKAEVQEGLTLYRIAGKRRRTPETFVPGAVYGRFAELEQERFDQVWLCVSTPAAQAGVQDPSSDLGRLVRNLHGATLVVLQSGPHVTRLIEEVVPPRQVCDGGIALVAYQAPLVPDEVPAPGVAYWAPTPSPFEGRDADTIVRLLKAGGCPAKEQTDTRATMAFGSAMLMPTMVALEGAGWKVAGLRRGEWAARAAGASAEARAIVAEHRGVTPPGAFEMYSSWLLKAATLVAGRVMPFDLDVYLKYHFSKVRDQTRLLIDQYISDGEAVSLPTEQLRNLRERVLA